MMTTMQALVYEGPKMMNVRTVDVPTPGADEVLIKVAYSGICGSELSGYLGQNALRKPPLIMGHEFSGTLEHIGDEAARLYPDLHIGQTVTANPLLSCRRCAYCLSGRQQLCPQRKLLSATLPGSNAQWVTVRADAVLPLPDGMPLTTAALTEPAACAVHAVGLAAPRPHETAVVVGAGPIGLLLIQALQDSGVKTVYVADLNRERLAMAQDLGADALTLDQSEFNGQFDMAFEAVGVDATRQGCLRLLRPGGRVFWLGLHEANSELPVNDMIRREIIGYGSFAYTALDFSRALAALAVGRLYLKDTWTRIEPLERGSACFEELLAGSAVAKIWLSPE
ncbi:MAG: alcohol dehydrogenase catalytic domain-containing protein [Anaerolineae bacterium]